MLFRRLALFRGFSLEAAEAVAAGEELAAWDVLDALGRLVEKSLITVEVRTGGEQERFRYRMVESLRQFAESELNDAAPSLTPPCGRPAAKATRNRSGSDGDDGTLSRGQDRAVHGLP